MNKYIICIVTNMHSSFWYIKFLTNARKNYSHVKTYLYWKPLLGTFFCLLPNNVQFICQFDITTLFPPEY